jgi:putative phosphoribosyl transferase
VINTDLVRSMGPLDDYINHETSRQLAEIERRREAYLGNRSRTEITGKTAIVVDDGIATGATMRAALRAVRLQRPAHLVLAVPVAPASARDDFKHEADEFICLEAPEPFYAVGPCYERFDQVSDDEVVRALDRAAERQSAGRN